MHGHYPLASPRFSSVLAPEIRTAPWPAEGTAGHLPAHSRDERCQSSLGRGAPRIHGELLKLGIDVGQTTVAKYMARRRRPPSQGWKTFLRNRADGIAIIGMFVVRTGRIRILRGAAVTAEDYPVGAVVCVQART